MNNRNSIRHSKRQKLSNEEEFIYLEPNSPIEPSIQTLFNNSVIAIKKKDGKIRYDFPTYIEVANGIVNINHAYLYTIAIIGKLNDELIIAGYIQYYIDEPSIKIQYIEVRTGFKGLRLCNKLIDILIHRYPAIHEFKINNFGGLAGYKCYTSTFRKNSFSITEPLQHKIAELNNKARNNSKKLNNKTVKNISNIPLHNYNIELTFQRNQP